MADTLKPYSQKTSQSNHTKTTALSNSMKLSHAHGVTQDGRVMVERSDRMWSTGEGNGKPLQYSCLENPMNSMKRYSFWSSSNISCSFLLQELCLCFFFCPQTLDYIKCPMLNVPCFFLLKNWLICTFTFLCLTVWLISNTSVQFSSVAQLCLTLCDPMNRSTPGLPVHHQLPEFTQTHVYWIGDAIQPSHPLSSPSPHLW